VPERERDLERLLTFVDAVVAIAITLLVLPLAEIGSQVGDMPVAELLAEHATDILGFVLSFVVIARLWLGQHRIVSSLIRQSTAVIWLLLLWTFTIVVLPFPTSLAAGTAHDPLVKVLYIGTMTVSSFVLALIAWTIGHDRNLRDTDRKPDLLQAAGTTVTFVVALAITVAFPATSYWPLLLLVLTDPVVRQIRRSRAKATRADA
jgi:uncharacterized membrane protein